MNFTFTPEQEAFRSEVREFIEKEFPPERRGMYRDLPLIWPISSKDRSMSFQCAVDHGLTR